MNLLDKQSMILRGAYIRTPLFIPNLNELYNSTGIDTIPNDPYTGTGKELTFWLRDVYHPQICYDERAPIDRSGNLRGEIHVFNTNRSNFPVKFHDPTCTIETVYKSTQVFTYQWFKRTKCLDEVYRALSKRSSGGSKITTSDCKEMCNTVVDICLITAYKSCPNAADWLYRFILDNIGK